MRCANAFLTRGEPFQNSSVKMITEAIPPNRISYPSGHNQWWVCSICSSAPSAAATYSWMAVIALIARPPRR